MNYYPYKKTLSDIPEPFRRYSSFVEKETEASDQPPTKGSDIDDILFLVLAYMIVINPPS